METSMTRAEFEFLARRAGLDLPTEKLDELHGIFGHIEAAATLVRQHGEAEPANVFSPVEGKS